MFGKRHNRTFDELLPRARQFCVWGVFVAGHKADSRIAQRFPESALAFRSAKGLHFGWAAEGSRRQRENNDPSSRASPAVF